MWVHVLLHFRHAPRETERARFWVRRSRHTRRTRRAPDRAPTHHPHVETPAGIGDDVIAACEAYLASKRAEFAARLVDLVATARAAIAAVWDDMKVRSCGWVDVEAGREWGARQRGTHACRAF